MYQGKVIFCGCLIAVLILLLCPSIVLGKGKFWQTSLNLNLDYSIPSGKYYGYEYYPMNSGIGFEGSFYIAATEGVEIGFNVNKSGIKYTSSYDYDNYKVKVAVTRYSIAARVHKPMNAMRREQFIPYWTAEIGVSKITVKYESGRNSKDSFSIGLGGGAVYLIAPRIGIDFGADFDLTFGDVKKVYNENSWFDLPEDIDLVCGYIIDIRLGMAFFF
ncbi:MAG: hypothetical protein GY865_15950 [candidate division Zixibacteria bacterium]|nr:hypothetical protein [candidate division Zixibacteria bacterium]